MPPHRRVLLAAALSALALPAAARAETFCVNHPTCVGSPEPGVQEALDAAAGNGVRTHDRIEIGPGTYVHGPSGRFTNVPMSPVTMVGSGNATVLTGNSSAPPGVYVLTVAERATKVTDLRVRIASSGFGLSLAGIAERVSVTSPASAGAHTGVFLQAPGVFRHGEIELLGPDGLSGAGAVGPGTIEDSTIQASTGLAAARARRVRIRAVVGVVCSLATITVDQALIELADTPSSIGLHVSTYGIRSTLNATNVTVVGAGAGTGLATGGGTPLFGSSTAALNVSSSVVRGVSTDVRRFGSTESGHTGAADVTIRHSSYDLSAVTSTGPGTLTATEGNIDDLDPRFVGGGDYRPRHDSPLLELGDPAAPGAGASDTDTAGQPRVVDGDEASGARRDMGAFEYQRKPPTAAVAINPAAPVAGRDVELSAAKSVDPDGEPLSYTWDFAGAAEPGHGETLTRNFPDPGAQHVTLQVTDATGLSATRSVSFTVGAPSPLPPPESRRVEVAPPSSHEGACARFWKGTRKPQTMRGGALGDRLLGRGGQDRLIGRGGDDCLGGGPGNDYLHGGAGADRLKGGRGNDRIDARDGARDFVDCGAGRRDVALVDRVDRVRRCERVRRSSR